MEEILRESYNFTAVAASSSTNKISREDPRLEYSEDSQPPSNPHDFE